jgi:hypothetical protein
MIDENKTIEAFVVEFEYEDIIPITEIYPGESYDIIDDQ